MYQDKFIKGYLRFSTVFLSRREVVHTYITPSLLEIPCRAKLRKCIGYGVQLVILRGGEIRAPSETILTAIHTWVPSPGFEDVS